MADDTGQETKERDPVQAIREALSRAMTSLKKLFAEESEELDEELEEVEVASGGQSAGAVKPAATVKPVKASLPKDKPAIPLTDPADDEDDL